MIDTSHPPDRLHERPFLALTPAMLGVLLTLFTSLGGLVWYISAQNTNFAIKNTINEAQIGQLRTDFAEELRSARAAIGERMDRTDVEMQARRTALYARLDNDERDTKSAAAFVNSVDLRLTRMEAQLDLVVKNMTAVPGSRR